MGLFDIFSGDSARAAAAQKEASVRQGYSELASLFGQGRDALASNAGKAAGYYQPIYDTALKGYGALADALGLNGADGNTRARAAFAAAPGYEAQLQAGLDAIDRGAAARGTLSSGGTRAAELKYGNDLAAQGWSNYLNALAGYGGQALGAAGGLGNLYSGLGSGLDASYRGLGQSAYNSALGVGNAKAEAEMADYNASQNLWKTILDGANTTARIYALAQRGGLSRTKG
ncbi:MAG TPA: hypothetical protein VNR11_21555 [Xanthobacteraceae bacterium]|nr:hypothetical protein [Xanthobacteraceae bacterium]